MTDILRQIHEDLDKAILAGDLEKIRAANQAMAKIATQKKDK